jgi:hypothetical protein
MPQLKDLTSFVEQESITPTARADLKAKRQLFRKARTEAVELALRGESERRRAETKAQELVAHKGQLEASIQSMVEKQLRAKRLSPERLREAFCINFMMGAMTGDIEVEKNEFGRKDKGYEIVRPLGGGITTAKLVAARNGFVLAVRDGESMLNPVFLIAKPFAIAQDEHDPMRKLLTDTLHKYMKAYMYIDTLHMPYSH